MNSRVELAIVNAAMRRRLLERLMLAGVTVEDPETTYVDWGVEVGRDTLIRANTHLLGRTTVGAASEVGPGSFLRDAFVGDRARVISSHLYECVISSGCNVGPFAYIRPNTVLAEGAKAGTFVEIKNSRIGERSKVPHLSYVGDAIVGVDSNIAAGNITANYDGYDKHATHIGDRVRTGSDTTIVAPVSIGDDAFTAAGSVITRDVPAGALGVAREQQKNVPGYAERRAARRLREQDERRGRAHTAVPARGFGTIVDRSAANTEREANGGGQHLLRDLAAQAAHDLLGAQQPRPRGEDRRQAGHRISAASSSRRSPTARSTPATRRTCAAPTCSSSSRRRTTSTASSWSCSS